jgi:tetratricopeptide (TPR) repeat protein
MEIEKGNDPESEVMILFEEYATLYEESDYEGAEEILAQLLSLSPVLEARIHYEYGRLYVRWNKLSSALKHFAVAAEKAHQRKDLLLLAQINVETKFAKDRQAEQKP